MADEQLRAALRTALNMVEDLTRRTGGVAQGAEFERLNLLAGGSMIDRSNSTWKEIDAERVFEAGMKKCPTCGSIIS